MQNPHILFPADGTRIRSLAASLYDSIKALPIISPHGHTDPRWFAENKPFPNPTALFVQPDHYIFRMLYSQGISLESLGVPQSGIECRSLRDRRSARRMAHLRRKLFPLPRNTHPPLARLHLRQPLRVLSERLSAKNADAIYDLIAEKLTTAEFLPRTLYERFNIEVLATTDAATDSLEHHSVIKASGWRGKSPSHLPP